MYRVNQAEYGFDIRVAASQEYVNTYSPRRVVILTSAVNISHACRCSCLYLGRYSRASVLETLLTAQTRLVLQTATQRRQERSTQTDTKTSTP